MATDHVAEKWETQKEDRCLQSSKEVKGKTKYKHK